MNQSVILSQRVINTLKSLSREDRHAIASAIMDEVVLGDKPTTLNPVNAMLYTMISFYVKQDTSRYQDTLSRGTIGSLAVV